MKIGSARHIPTRPKRILYPMMIFREPRVQNKTFSETKCGWRNAIEIVCKRNWPHVGAVSGNVAAASFVLNILAAHQC